MAGGMAQLEEEESRMRGFTSGTARVGVSWRRSSSLRQSMFSKLEDAAKEGIHCVRQHEQDARAHTHTYVRIHCIHFNEMRKLENDTNANTAKSNTAVNTRAAKHMLSFSLTVDFWQKFRGCWNTTQITCLRERVHLPRLLASVVA